MSTEKQSTPTELQKQIDDQRDLLILEISTFIWDRNHLRQEYPQFLDHVKNIAHRVTLTVGGIPPFVEYNVNKEGNYCLSWRNKVLTPEQFKTMKKDYPEVFFWCEAKDGEQ